MGSSCGPLRDHFCRIGVCLPCRAPEALELPQRSETSVAMPCSFGRETGPKRNAAAQPRLAPFPSEAKMSDRYHKKSLGNRPLHPETLMLGYGYDPALSEGAVKPPVFLTSTFV